MTQRRLEKFIDLMVQTENLDEQIRRMKSSEKFPSMREADGSSRQPGASDRMGNAIIKRLTLEEELNEKIDANKAEMDAIRKAIWSLEKPKEQTVLWSKYIDWVDEDGTIRNLHWNEVAFKLYRNDDEKDISRAKRLHNKALQNIRKVEI